MPYANRRGMHAGIVYATAVVLLSIATGCATVSHRPVHTILEEHEVEERSLSEVSARSVEDWKGDDIMLDVHGAGRCVKLRTVESGQLGKLHGGWFELVAGSVLVAGGVVLISQAGTIGDTRRDRNAVIGSGAVAAGLGTGELVHVLVKRIQARDHLETRVERTDGYTCHDRRLEASDVALRLAPETTIRGTAAEDGARLRFSGARKWLIEHADAHGPTDDAELVVKGRTFMVPWKDIVDLRSIKRVAIEREDQRRQAEDAERRKAHLAMFFPRQLAKGIAAPGLALGARLKDVEAVAALDVPTGRHCPYHALCALARDGKRGVASKVLIRKIQFGPIPNLAEGYVVFRRGVVVEIDVYHGTDSKGLESEAWMDAFLRTYGVPLQSQSAELRDAYGAVMTGTLAEAKLPDGLVIRVFASAGMVGFKVFRDADRSQLTELDEKQVRANEAIERAKIAAQQRQQHRAAAQAADLAAKRATMKPKEGAGRREQ